MDTPHLLVELVVAVAAMWPPAGGPGIVSVDGELHLAGAEIQAMWILPGNEGGGPAPGGEVPTD